MPRSRRHREGGAVRASGPFGTRASNPARGGKFPKQMRLRKRREFLAVQNSGKKLHSKHFLAVIAPRASTDQSDQPGDGSSVGGSSGRFGGQPGDGSGVGGGQPGDGSSGRVGLTVSKKVGNAVTRNRVKRLLREFVRRNPLVPDGCDVVVIAKPSAGALRGYGEAAADLARLSARIRERRSRR